MSEKLVLAVPKGRILEELLPKLEKAGIVPEAAFFEKENRQLRFATNIDYLDIIRVRSFDVATFVAFGAAAIGVAGSDVIAEFDNLELYAPLSLGIGTCRLSIAAPREGNIERDFSRLSHLRIATKYPSITKKYFEGLGIQAECVKLNGAMELAPLLDMCPYIVDLVSTGSTLKANGLEEIDTIMEVSSYVVMNRTISKTRAKEMQALLERFKDVADG
jgi:ATP phosphoribosyltransferase